MDISAYLRQAIAQLEHQFRQELNRLAAMSRIHEQRAERLEHQLGELRRALAAVRVTAQTPRADQSAAAYIDQLPGKREPFTLLAAIPIAANSVQPQRVPVVVSQEGPFVAVRRFATFLSAYEFSTTDPETGETARFLGRSYGRFRPVHSAADYLDSQHNAKCDVAGWYYRPLLDGSLPSGSNLPSAALALASSASSFRTMEFDGMVQLVVSSGMERQNIAVPTSQWVDGAGGQLELGCLDFLDRGETVTFIVTPTHVNNPPFGNVSGQYVLPFIAASSTPWWPYVDGQYDPHEGIATPGATGYNSSLPGIGIASALTADSVSRLPLGTLYIGFEGYRIRQIPCVPR